MIKAIKNETAKIDVKKAEKWLDSHWKDGHAACHVCGNEQWHIINDILEMRTYGDFNGPIYPYLAVLCATCGNTLFFNAKFAGLVSQPE